MTRAQLDSNTKISIPSTEEIKLAGDFQRKIDQFTKNDNIKISLSSSSGAKQVTEIPQYAVRILLDLFEQVSQGNAVTLIPVHAELTTQEAADLLSVSRPYLVSLLETHQMPFHWVGSHRRVLAKDILDYKKDLDLERKKVLDELAALNQELEADFE